MLPATQEKRRVPVLRAEKAEESFLARWASLSEWMARWAGARGKTHNAQDHTSTSSPDMDSGQVLQARQHPQYTRR